MELGKDPSVNTHPDAGFGVRNQTSGGHNQSDELKRQYKDDQEKLDKDQTGHDELFKIYKDFKDEDYAENDPERKARIERAKKLPSKTKKPPKK